jgi:hypothetical protein
VSDAKSSLIVLSDSPQDQRFIGGGNAKTAARAASDLPSQIAEAAHVSSSFADSRSCLQIVGHASPTFYASRRHATPSSDPTGHSMPPTSVAAEYSGTNSSLCSGNWAYDAVESTSPGTQRG